MEKGVFKITLDESKYRPMPDDIYRVRLVDIEKTERTNFSWHEVFEFIFQVIGGEFDGMKINCYVNKSKDDCYGPTSKMCNFFRILAGKEHKMVDFDPAYLIGKECLAQVELITKGLKKTNRIVKLEPIDG